MIGPVTGLVFCISLGFGMSGKMSGDRVRRQVPKHDNVTAPSNAWMKATLHWTWMAGI